MTTGAMLYAFDNEHIDYLCLASWCADNIHRHLDLPVCVVTDRQDVSGNFDHVINLDPAHYVADPRWFDDFGTTVCWHNQSRADAYDLSPWDQTLLLDADYVVASPQLRTLLDVPAALICHDRAWNAVKGEPCTDLNVFGRYAMPMSWATVMLFRREPEARDTFTIMKMVRDHWKHYRDLYDFGRGPYRNDYALSIARHLMSGHRPSAYHIPWPLISVMPHHDLRQLDRDGYRVSYQGRYIELTNTDFHAMGKKQLGDIVAKTA